MNPSPFFEAAVSLPLQVAVVLAATVLMDRWIGSAKTSCQLWTVCFVSVLGIVAAALLLPHLRLVHLTVSVGEMTVRAVLAWQAVIINAVGLLWCLGFVWIVARRGVRYLMLMQFLSQRCRPLTEQEILRLPLEGRDAVPENIRWLVSDDQHGPFCWQLQRPMVILPKFVMNEDADVLRHILLHEIGHLQTNHPVQHFLQGLCGAILWFHPAWWWAARRADLSREYFCDEVAAKADGAIAGYLRTLAKVAEYSVNAPPCTLAFGRRKSAIVRRSERLLHIAERSSGEGVARESIGQSRLAIAALVLMAILASQLWLPVNVLASSRSHLSPWPTWSAEVLHDFGITVRDYERFDARHRLHELLTDDD